MPRSIPIYLDIEVDTATGFDGWNDATFKEWMRTVKELGNCTQSTPVKTCGGMLIRMNRQCMWGIVIVNSRFLQRSTLFRQRAGPRNQENPLESKSSTEA